MTDQKTKVYQSSPMTTKCPHIVLSSEQTSGQILNSGKGTLQICDECIQQILINHDNTSIMKFSDYQKRTSATAEYPDDFGLWYLTLGLVGEAGEIANKIKKIIRGDYAQDEIADNIGDELGDVLWYISELASLFNKDLSVIAQRNLNKLAKRKEMGLIKGSGDDRGK